MTRGRSNADRTMIIESSGNARIVDRSGETVAVLEDWTLWVDGSPYGEVSNYHEAIERTKKALTE